MLEPSRYQDPRTWKMTPAMLRARQPYVKGNLFGLVTLLGVAGGIYAYTYRALHKDDDFADVPIPPVSEEELRQLRQEYELHKKQRAAER
ncbi:AaceriAEL163Cp [[Ashbya] aceris (nom. inval.)]|nr:AaceriAEL163Cp [[Ashbya] aceris (nom. inval.)]